MGLGGFVCPAYIAQQLYTLTLTYIHISLQVFLVCKCRAAHKSRTLYPLQVFDDNPVCRREHSSSARVFIVYVSQGNGMSEAQAAALKLVDVYYVGPRECYVSLFI